MVVVYTCILNSWDFLRKPQAIDPHARYVCFTNRHLDPVYPWEIQPAYELTGDAARDSRLPKILPHLHLDAEYSIWHDGNFQLRMQPEEVIERTMRNGADIAMFAHPCRTTVEQEAECLLRENIGNASDVLNQLATWRAHGSPAGLWAGGFIVRRHTPQVETFNNHWWMEFRYGSTRDQLAIPIARAATGVNINTLPGDVYNNPFIAFHWHSAWRDKADNPELQPRADEIERRYTLLKDLCRTHTE